MTYKQVFKNLYCVNRHRSYHNHFSVYVCDLCDELLLGQKAILIHRNKMHPLDILAEVALVQVENTKQKQGGLETIYES